MSQGGVVPRWGGVLPLLLEEEGTMAEVFVRVRLEGEVGGGCDRDVK